MKFLLRFAFCLALLVSACEGNANGATLMAVNTAGTDSVNIVGCH
jgi:hypothetical protein